MSEVIEDQAAFVADLMARLDAAEAELERWQASARLGWRTARTRMTRTTELERRLAGVYLLCDSHGPAPHKTVCHRCAPLLRDALTGQP